MQEPRRTGLNFVKQEGGPPHNAEHTFQRFSKRKQQVKRLSLRLEKRLGILPSKKPKKRELLHVTNNAFKKSFIDIADKPC